MGTHVRLQGRVMIDGPAAAVDDRSLPGGQARLAFAALVLERSRPLSRHELADIVWPDTLPGTWESALRNLVSRVRVFVAAAGQSPTDVVTHDAAGYRLALGDDSTVDIEQAEELTARAGERLLAGEPAAAAQAAAAARGILVEPFLPGVENPWVDRVRDRLADLAVRAGELAAEARLRLGEHQAAVAEAEAVIDAAPIRESGYRLLMLALDAGGNRAEALRAYERCRRTLVDELGVDPSAETEAVYRELLGAEPAIAPAPAPASLRPTGTVTFLHTDIEGSSSLWERDPAAMTDALQIHDDEVAAAVHAHGGRLFKHTGTGVAAVFAAARDAVGAAVAAQRGLAARSWPVEPPVRVRMGLHTGEAQVRGDDYIGVALSRVVRVCALAQGGQILASSSTRLVVEGRLPPEVVLRYVGDANLRGAQGAEPVFNVDHPDLPTGFAVLEPGRGRLLGVVAEDGPLIGRVAEVQETLSALSAGQVVTLVGVAGVGKTRLAAAVVNVADGAGADRVVWVSLLETTGDGVADAVAVALGGARQGADVLETAVEELGRLPTLLVLDNCEHLLDPARHLIEAVLARCPQLLVLATSRAPLGATAERIVALEPLPAPSEGSDYQAIVASPAVEFFARRARASNPRFEVGTANAGPVSEICRRVDGLPLALELAAARTRAMSAEQIAAHLDERFRLLRQDGSRATGRSRSLDAALRWSHQLLDEPEQRLFEAVSVYAGTFDLAGALAVAGDGPGPDELDVLDRLDALVTQSMVVFVDDDAQPGYRLLETMRDFGRLTLAERGELAAAEARHAAHHLALVEAAEAGLRGPEEAAWVDRLHRSLPDIAAVVTAAIAAGDLDTSTAVVVDLFEYAFFRMRREVGLWALDTVALPGVEAHPRFADAAAVAGYLAWQRGDLDTAATWTARAVEAGGGWIAYDALGTTSMFQGRVSAAVEAWERSASLAADAGDIYREVLSRGQVAFGLMFTGDGAAVDHARQAKELAASIDNPTASAHAAWAHGMVLFDLDPPAALLELETAIALSRTVDNRLSVGAAMTPAEELRTKVARRTRHTDLATALERLEHWEQVGHAPTMWSTVRRIGRTLADLGHLDGAALAFAAEAAASMKLPLGPGERRRDRHAEAVARVRSALGEDAFEAVAERAARLSPAEVVAELRAAIDSLESR